MGRGGHELDERVERFTARLRLIELVGDQAQRQVRGSFVGSDPQELFEHGFCVQVTLLFDQRSAQTGEGAWMVGIQFQRFSVMLLRLIERTGLDRQITAPVPLLGELFRALLGFGLSRLRRIRRGALGPRCAQARRGRGVRLTLDQLGDDQTSEAEERERETDEERASHPPILTVSGHRRLNRAQSLRPWRVVHGGLGSQKVGRMLDRRGWVRNGSAISY